MKKYTLQGNVREVTGRKVKTLRKAGEIPGTVYGRKVESISVSVAAAAFEKVYERAGETGLVELTISNEIHPVLIHNVQTDPVTDHILHVEFYQVDLKEKVRTKVPLELVGESPAVAEKRGVVLSLLSEVEVEALPTELPEKIEVDITVLTEVDQEISVSGLHAPSGVTVLTEGTVSVAKVGALVSKEAEEQAAAEAAEAAEEAAGEEEGAEGGEQKAEEGEKKAEEKTGEGVKDKPAEKKEDSSKE